MTTKTKTQGIKEEIRTKLKWFIHRIKGNDLSAETSRNYAVAIGQFASFLEQEGLPTTISETTREHVEAFLAALRASSKRSSTVHARYRQLHAFYEVLVEEGDIEQSPMVRMKAPKVKENHRRVLTSEQLSKLLATVSGGKRFDERRDHAMLSILCDTGMRRGELLALRYAPNNEEINDVDLDAGELRVFGKGSKWRTVPIGHKTVSALYRYLSVREKHRQGDRTDALWVSQRGPMAASGVGRIIQRRATEAGLGRVHPHLLRHAFANLWLSNGGQEGDLMRVAGWKSRAMMARYASGAAEGRAKLAHRRLGPRDNL